MNRKVLIFFLFLIVFAGSARTDQVTTGVDLTATQYNNGQKIGRDSIGNIYFVYQKSDGAYYQIYVSKSSDNGTTWSGTGQNGAINPSSSHQRYPSMAIDSRDHVHVVWEENGKIMYSEYDGTFWGQVAAVQNNPTGTQQAPALAIDKNNVLHTVWYETEASTSQIKYSMGPVWSTPVTVHQGLGAYNQEYPSLAVDNDNNIHVVWSGYDASNNFQPQIKYSSKSPTANWDESTWVNISTNPVQTCSQENPAIAIGKNNEVYVVWHGTDTSNATTQIKFNKFDGSTWNTWENVQVINGYEQRYPCLAVDVNNNLHLFWYGDDSASAGNTQIKYSRYNGSSWTQWKNIAPSSTQQQYPTVRSSTFFINEGSLDWGWATAGSLMFERDASIVMSYAIKGTVWDSRMVPMEDVIVTLSGDRFDQKKTSSDGSYGFHDLISGNYTVTPSQSSWSFKPESREYAPLDSEQSGQDFIGLKGSVEENELKPVNNLFEPDKGEGTMVWYTTSRTGRVTISIYTLDGVLVKTLVDEEKEAGVHTARWLGKNLSGDIVASGIYLVHIEAPGFKDTKKVCVIR